MNILDLPKDERPRERFAQKGAAAVSSSELIAILLGSGTKESSALDLGSELLGRFGSLEKLSDATLQELLAIKGIKMAKAVKLLAAFALWKRLMKPQTEGRPVIDSPQKAFQEIYPMFRDEKKESVIVLLRDARKGLLEVREVALGTLNQVLMHPREIFYTAIRHRAHSLIVAHNHPTGDPTPSKNDVEMTQVLRSSGFVIGIPLVDHLIIGNGCYYSFWREGRWGEEY